MNGLKKFQTEIINLNRLEYSEKYNSLSWLNEAQAVQATKRREEILASLKDNVKSGFKNTKIDVTQLSPGCQLCAQGSWSCLFINGKCNCNCFYCPSKQDEIGLPITNSITFPAVKEYIRYLEYFNFKGVSISGGEPLLSFDKTLHFLKKIKSHFGNKIYFWLYTNSTLLTVDKIKKLSNAGLDEIRIDAGAVNYSLKKAKLAVGLIPKITVETPAVPEDIKKLKLLCHQMADYGFNFLNLHQLRLTPYNFSKFSKRNYTYIHGPKVCILESEFTALQIIQYTKQQKLKLPVNYCSFAFKNRFQLVGARKRYAHEIKQSFDSVTENAYIRNLQIKGEESAIYNLISSLSQQGVSPEYYSKQENALFFHPKIFPFINFDKFSLYVRYQATKLFPAVSYRNPFKEINLSAKKSIFIEKKANTNWLKIEKSKIISFIQFIQQDKTPPLAENSYDWIKIALHEKIEQGFQDYY